MFCEHWCSFFAWIYVYISLGHISLQVELLDHMAILCLNFRGRAWLLSKVATQFHIHTSSEWGFQFLHLPQSLLLSVFLILAILVGMKWYLIVVLNCISLSSIFNMLIVDIGLLSWIPWFDSHIVSKLTWDQSNPNHVTTQVIRRNQEDDYLSLISL